MIGIYKITNLKNQKVYIGQSVNIQRRWTQHKNSDKDYPLYNDFKKYGIDNFSFEVIKQCDKKELNQFEQLYIKQYNSTNEKFGYNQTITDSIYGHPIVFNNEALLNLIDDLMYSTISKEKLAIKYNCNERAIRDINTGRAWYNKELTYPLRKFFVGKDGKKYSARIEINSGKSIPISKICPKCGGIKHSTSKLCKQCSILLQRTVNRPSKENLINEIIACGFTATGRKYGVSDNAIRKWCKYYELPTLKKDLIHYKDCYLKNLKNML